LLSVLMIGIFLFGCVTNQVIPGGEDNVTVQPGENTTVQPEPGTFEFSVPSELPIAYVGKPYSYSFCDPQAVEEPEYHDFICGDNVTTKNPTGGESPYSFTFEQITKSDGWYAFAFYQSLYTSTSAGGLLNFTPAAGDEGEYKFTVCATDRSYPSNQVCKNTTLYIMSDTIKIKGEGELTHYLLLKLNSKVRAADGRGNEDEKDIKTNYVRAANFSFAKVTAEVSASPSSCEHFCGGGSYSAQDVIATDTSVSVIADGNAACGRALGPGFPDEYNVDYYMVGYVGYTDNTYLALDITNTGTKEKAVDITLEASSEVDSRSQHYFSVSANAVACVKSDRCVNVPTGKPGAQNVNSTVFRVLVRPGIHRIDIGSMNDNFANTNMLTCPSFIKASSKVSVTIVPADIGDGKKAVARIYSGPKESYVWDVTYD